MKKILCIFLCLFVGLGIGIPLIYNDDNRLRAAVTYKGEKVVDIEFPGSSPSTARKFSYLYAVTGNKNVYYREYQALEWILIKDEKGKPLENIRSISGTYYDTSSQHEYIALREDDQIYIKGLNDGRFGFTDSVETNFTEAKLINPGITDIKEVELGNGTSYLLTENGDLYASGNNEHGQLGNGSKDSTSVYLKLPINNVKKIQFVYPSTVFALKNDGTVWGWGGYVYDGKTEANDVLEPVQIFNSASGINEFFDNAVDIVGATDATYPILGIATVKDNKAINYQVGQAANKGTGVFQSGYINGVDLNDITSLASWTASSSGFIVRLAFLNDGIPYWGGVASSSEATLETKFYGYDGTADTKAIKILYKVQQPYILNRKGELWTNSKEPESIERPLVLSGEKKDNSEYKSYEKYNDSVTLNIFSTENLPVTCYVEDPLGSTKISCDNLSNNSILNDTKENDRVYRKYIIANELMSDEFVIDLYKTKPTITGLSTTSSNKIKTGDRINVDAPTEQSSWNKYTAQITDETGITTDYTGGTLATGKYTLLVTDSYGNTQSYQIEVSDNPEPTAGFNPASTSLTYGDNPTKVNNTIGTFTLSYPAGEPTSNIKTIQLDSSGDESHFSVDTTGALKVKGTDLDAGTYSVTVSGTDGNDMPFTKTVSITVAKKNQDNYQITNNANYSLQVNQEINITTTGNESGENETYTITNGGNVAQIIGNKFKLLGSGTFTLQATVGGNTNYNSKTVTKQITVSQLPTQNPPVSITSSASMMYGDNYTPSYSGGQGSGAVSWKVENDNGTGAVLSNGKVTVTGIGTFTLKVTKAGTSSYQESTATKVITVNKRKTIVKPKDVTKTVGQAFKDNGATYTPQPVSGDNLGTLTITSKYPDNQAAGRYTDGIQASGLSNPNYEFEYQEGTLIINSNSLPNNGDGYYKVTGTKGKNNWYVSNVQIFTTNKNGYDEISKDGVNFQKAALVYSTDGDYPTEFYLRNSSTGIIAKAIRYQLKIDQTPPDVPSLSMKEINKNAIARFINALSFGNWMNQAVQVTITSTDTTSGIDHYEYNETSQSGTNTKTSTNGIVTYKDDVEIIVKAKACDKAGNCSALSNDESIMIDTKAPTITGVKDKSEYKHYYLSRFVNVKDSYSGLSYSEYKKDGTMAGTIQNNVDEKISDIGEYEVYAIDNAGNEITISFKIVPLPDIETEIDGSDESKEIIDQIKDELAEIKDKIDETEKKDIEDWIKDAEDKWNSLRKKVVETDDKSAKVEGQGDTDFDPSVILIVDDITDQANDIPPLPRKAIAVYDVWLQKGNIRIQPDGSIKVYLPYAGNIGKAMGGAINSLADPIVYQIDEKDKVTEISCKREGNFVTFITDELLRYAISDENQDLNKDDDTCVVGPDGKPNTGDEVCGLPSDDGKQPEKKPDGSVEVPDGGKVEFPNGTEIDTPDGAIIHPDGSVTLPDGTEYDPDGNKKPNDTCVVGPDGDVNTGDEVCGLPSDDGKQPEKKPNGSVEVPDGGKVEFPNGTEIDTPDGAIIHPDGSVTLPDGTEYDPNGNKKPNKQCALEGKDINVDTDGDGLPDLNLDIDGDCVSDLNIDTNFDNIPDINIDTKGDGKADINIDTDNDGKADLNIAVIKRWIPNKNCNFNGLAYDTGEGFTPILNIDTDGDGKADRNIDTNGDGIPDLNVDSDWNEKNNKAQAIGGANTGDHTKWVWWWIILILTGVTMIYSHYKKHALMQQSK